MNWVLVLQLTLLSVAAGSASASAAPPSPPPSPSPPPPASTADGAAAVPDTGDSDLITVTDSELNTEELTRVLYEVYSYPPLSPLLPPHDQPIPPVRTSAGLGAVPARTPALAAIEPLSLTSPSHLSELNHYVFRGRADFCRPFRVLIAGGGTGQKTANLVAQLVDMNRYRVMNDRRQRRQPLVADDDGTAAAEPLYEVVHIDLSERSIDTARARVERRLLERQQQHWEEDDAIRMKARGEYAGINRKRDRDRASRSRRHADVESLAHSLGVRLSFHRASIFDLPSLGAFANRTARFDYIDCVGVVHIIPDAIAAMRVLTSFLSPTGGMGMMVYAVLGRHGIYHVRDMLQALESVDGDNKLMFTKRIARTRELLRSLPATHALRVDPYRWNELTRYLLEDGDVALVDTFLPPYEKPYLVSDLWPLLALNASATAPADEVLRPTQQPAETATESTAEPAAAAEPKPQRLITFLPPCNYDPKLYIPSPSPLLDEVLELPLSRQFEFVELFSGAIYHHFWYSVPSSRRESTVATIAPDMIPIMNHVWSETILAKLARQRTTSLHWKYQGVEFVFPPFSPLAVKILSHIDGRRSLATIHQRMIAATAAASATPAPPPDASTPPLPPPPPLSWIDFRAGFSQLFDVLNSMDRIYLSRYPAVYDNEHYHTLNITCPL